MAKRVDFNSLVNRFSQVGFGVAVGFLTLQSSLFTVDAGQRALIFDRIRGVLPSVKAEGTHFKIPFIQTPYYFDVRITPRSIKSDTASKDLQRIHINVRVLYRPNQDLLRNIFTQYGVNYDESIIPSIGNEVIKAVIAQFNAEELVTQRDSVSRLIRAGLVERASSFGLILEDVAITHIGFSREYTSAIERKQVESQLAERQKFIVEKSRQEKLAEVILAEGETEAARVIAESMRASSQFLELRRIEAAKEIAHTLAESSGVTYLSGGANLLLNMGVGSTRQATK